MNDNTTNFDEYSDFLREAEKDNRLGKQTFMVVSATMGAWPSGDPLMDIDGVLTTANNSRVRFSLSPLPSKAQLEAEKATMSQAKKRGIAQSINFHKALAKLGKKWDGIQAGDEFNVEVVKNKEGFLRIAAILGKPGVPSDVKKDNVPGF